MTADCFRIDEKDNVATMLSASEGGPALVRNSASLDRIVLCEPVELGHKVALADIAAGAAIVKFGVSIGQASSLIKAGAWVHLHNCQSRFDERSGTLDLQTGATTDTEYE